MRKFIVLTVAAAMVAVCGVVAVAPVRAQEEAPKSVAATLTGTNYCLECTLRGAEEGATCSVESCHAVLRVKTAADAEGNAIEALVGTTVYYMHPKKGSELAAADIALFGKTVTLSGMLYIAERALDVQSVEVQEEKAAANEDDPFADFDDFDFSSGGNKASQKR